MLLAAFGQRFNERVASQKALTIRASSSQTVYEAGANTRRTLAWNAPTASPNHAILSNLTTLRDRSRASTRNNGYAKGIIDAHVSNIVGTGIKPLSQADDAAFREAIQALWLRWTDESDADGLLDFYGQQSQAVRGWREGGEIFARLRPRLPGDGLSVPLQIQVLEPELCPHDRNIIAPNGNRIRAGIEFSAIGKRVAYWFYPSRPRATTEDFDRSRLVRVLAENVIHLYSPERPGQLRGVPILTPALIPLNESDKFEDATLLRQQIQNLFAGFLTRPPKTGEGEALHPLTGLPIETSASGEEQILSMEPGIWQELDPGQEVTFSNPPDAGNSYPDFMRHQLMRICAAASVPYESVTGDMSKVNDRTVRVILNEFRRRVQAWQHQNVAFMFCRRVWKAWLDAAFLSEAITIPVDYIFDPTPWSKVKWMPQSWPYIHPVQDVQAAKEEVRNGLTTRSEKVSERGEDSEEIDREQAADNARADALGLKYDSDGRNQLKAATAPEPEPEEKEEEEEREKSEVPA